jgi:hypothetical protein
MLDWGSIDEENGAYVVKSSLLDAAANKVTAIELMYGQEAVLPVEVKLQTCRVLSTMEYTERMMDKINEIPESRFRALREMEKEKVRVAKAYN